MRKIGIAILLVGSIGCWFPAAVRAQAPTTKKGGCWSREIAVRLSKKAIESGTQIILRVNRLGQNGVDLLGDTAVNLRLSLMCSKYLRLCHNRFKIYLQPLLLEQLHPIEH